MDFQFPIELIGAVQHNPWGKRGADSLVSRLIGDTTDASRPDAELWLGSHPKFPARVAIEGKVLTLDELIRSAPEAILGKSIVRRFGAELPFLLKVLSIRTALSIQAHPDQELARKLHQSFPEHFPDDKRKVEIAIAISPVSMLHGFRLTDNFKKCVEDVAEFKDLLGRELLIDLGKVRNKELPSELLQKLYRTVLLTEQSIIKNKWESLLRRLERFGARTVEEEWLLKLAPEYKEGDIGLFCFFMLELKTLAPGQAILTPPGTPHAYLSGDLIECMSCSDNVVRGGLTSKRKDVEMLCQMVNYQPIPSPLVQTNFSLESVPDSAAQSGVVRLPFAIDEFKVDIISGEVGNIQFDPESSVEMIFALSGNGKILCGDRTSVLKPGKGYLIPASIGSYSIFHGKGTTFRVSVPPQNR